MISIVNICILLKYFFSNPIYIYTFIYAFNILSSGEHIQYGIIGFCLMFLPGLGLSGYYTFRLNIPPIVAPFFIIITVILCPIIFIGIMIAVLVHPSPQILELAFVALALEGMLEAAPQALLQCVYLMNGNIVTPTIIIAILTSIFTVSKVAVQFHYWSHQKYMFMLEGDQNLDDNESQSTMNPNFVGFQDEKTIRDIFMMGYFQKDYWWFFAHFVSSFLFRGGCLVFMIVYIKYWTIIPCALVLILVTYEFATEESLCCQSLSSKQESDFVYSHRGILKAFAMGVMNLCIMGKGKFGVDENFYKVSSSFIFLIYIIGMSVSVYLYSELLRDNLTKEFKIEIVATFASFVILSGVINLVLVWSQMMCLCVCHEKYVRKSIRLAQCVCKCKDKVNLDLTTLRRAKKPRQKQKTVSKSKTDDDKQNNALLSEPDLKESMEKDVTDSKKKLGEGDIQLEIQIETPQSDSPDNDVVVLTNNSKV